MTETLPPRSRKVKILATLGPASSDPRIIRKLLVAGADAFRINMSHGDQKSKTKLVEHIRALEKEFHRPTTILFDLQGPKLRVGHFQGGRTVLAKGERFIFDINDKAGDNPQIRADVIARPALKSKTGTSTGTARRSPIGTALGGKSLSTAGRPQ